MGGKQEDESAEFLEGAGRWWCGVCGGGCSKVDERLE